MPYSVLRGSFPICLRRFINQIRIFFLSTGRVVVVVHTHHRDHRSLQITDHHHHLANRSKLETETRNAAVAGERCKVVRGAVKQ